MKRLLFLLPLVALLLCSCEIFNPVNDDKAEQPENVIDVPTETPPVAGQAQFPAPDSLELAQIADDMATLGVTSVQGKVVVCRYVIRATEVGRDTIRHQDGNFPEYVHPIADHRTQRKLNAFWIPGKFPQHELFLQMYRYIKPELEGYTPDGVFDYAQIPNTCRMLEFTE